jgi:hypothetical protein
MNMSIQSVTSKPSAVANEAGATQQVRHPETQLHLQSSLASLRTINEAPSQSYYERAKDFLMSVWNWMKSLFCCCEKSDPTREKDVQTIKDLAARGYIVFSERSGLNPTDDTLDPALDFLTTELAYPTTVNGRTFASPVIAATASIVKDPEALESLSKLKVENKADFDKLVGSWTSDPAVSKKVFGDIDMNNLEALMDEACKKLQSDRFKNDPALKARLLATGDCLLVGIGNSEKAATVFMEIREELGGKKASPEAEKAYQKALNEAQNNQRSLIK